MDLLKKESPEKIPFKINSCHKIYGMYINHAKIPTSFLLLE